MLKTPKSNSLGFENPFPQDKLTHRNHKTNKINKKRDALHYVLIQ